MRQIKRNLGFISLLVTLCLLASCGGESDSEMLVGSWGADSNYSYDTIHFNEDGTYARYPPNLRDLPHSGGTYIFDDSHIELMGTNFGSIPLRCRDKREYYEVTNIEKNRLTIKILVDECSGEALVGSTDWRNTSDVITFERCEDVKRGEGIFYDCIPVEDE